MALNRFQRFVADNYAAGDFAHVKRPKQDVGDTLFTFLMIEMGDDCQDDPDEAMRRITSARLQLQELERLFVSTRSGLWPRNPPEIEQ